MFIRNRASYEDGCLKGEIKNCAGNQGTQITVEDMFYNVPQRKQFFKSQSEEFSRIMDVVSKYAIHNANVSFTLTKPGENASLRTPIHSTQLENIRIVYGNDVVSEMKSISCEDEHFQFKMSALATGVKYSSKKFTFLLFINNRLVESTGENLSREYIQLLSHCDILFLIFFFLSSTEKCNRPGLFNISAERKSSIRIP